MRNDECKLQVSINSTCWNMRFGKVRGRDICLNIWRNNCYFVYIQCDRKVCCSCFYRDIIYVFTTFYKLSWKYKTLVLYFYFIYRHTYRGYQRDV